MTQESIEIFFKRYEQFFMRALNGEIESYELSILYAQEFIAASPLGVFTGRNDNQLWKIMDHGYKQYREIGTKEMHVRRVSVSPIDEIHCVAHVAWIATYANANNNFKNIEIAFDVHYLMQELNNKLHIFGWISGDEQETLKTYGII